MRPNTKHPVVLLALLIGSAPCALLAAQQSTASDRTLALMPLQRGVRNQEAALAVATALEFQLTKFGRLLRPESSRDALRRLRLRNVDAAPPALLSQLAQELESQWLVVATLHDVPRHSVPDLALSLRIYDGATGELSWAGFLGRSGLDRRKALGLGVIDSMDELAPAAVDQLLAQVPIGGEDRPRKPTAEPALSDSSLAVVPFTSYVEQDAQSVADTATDAALAVLMRLGARPVSPGCVREALRQQRSLSWGEIPPEARQEIHEACGAERILTGAVEQWDLAGTGLEPEPLVALSMRLLDARSGRILWMGSSEESGWKGESLLGLGRVHSRGIHLDRLMTRLVQELAGGEQYAPGSRPLESKDAP